MKSLNQLANAQDFRKFRCAWEATAAFQLVINGVFIMIFLIQTLTLTLTPTQILTLTLYGH